jgi:hypothetical protein
MLHAAARCSLQLLARGHSQHLASTLPALARHMSFEAGGGGEDPLDEFRDNVGAFAASVIAPHAEEVDKSNDFPKTVNLWKEMGEFGLLGECSTLRSYPADVAHTLTWQRSCLRACRHHRSRRVWGAQHGLPCTLHSNGGAQQL